MTKRLAAAYTAAGAAPSKAVTNTTSAHTMSTSKVAATPRGAVWRQKARTPWSRVIWSGSDGPGVGDAVTVSTRSRTSRRTSRTASAAATSNGSAQAATARVAVLGTSRP